MTRKLIWITEEERDALRKATYTITLETDHPSEKLVERALLAWHGWDLVALSVSEVETEEEEPDDHS